MISGSVVASAQRVVSSSCTSSEWPVTFCATFFRVSLQPVRLSTITAASSSAKSCLNIMACGTAEGTQKFKVALWKKVDGGAAYVPDSTYYVKTDGTDYRCTISGLDPAAQYRVTISYDSSRYYLYGLMKVEGIAG